VPLGTAQFQAVPGPEAGTGFGVLAMGGLVVYMKRRRKEMLLLKQIALLQ